MPSLLVAAHRDDEVLGAGGWLVQHPDTYVYWLGDWKRRGDAERTQAQFEQEVRQTHNALDALGVALPADSWGAGPPDNQFDTFPLLHLIQHVERVIERVKPEVVLTHQPHDLNVDHRLTCQAVLTATRPVPGQVVKAVYGFEVPSSTEWAFGAPPFAPNVFVPLSVTDIRKKLKALGCYESELRAFPHPRSLDAVEALAQWRGAQCGHGYAEAFMLLREIR